MHRGSVVSIERTKSWAGNLQDRMFCYHCVKVNDDSGHPNNVTSHNGTASAIDIPTGGSAESIVLTLKRFLKRVLKLEEDGTTQIHSAEPSTLAATESVPVEGRDGSTIPSQDGEMSIETHNTSSVVSPPVLPAVATDVDVCGWGWTKKNYKGTANYMQADGRWYLMPDGGMCSYYFRQGYRILATE
jgi:hypothetical protein